MKKILYLYLNALVFFASPTLVLAQDASQSSEATVATQTIQSSPLTFIISNLLLILGGTSVFVSLIIISFVLYKKRKNKKSQPITPVPTITETPLPHKTKPLPNDVDLDSIVNQAQVQIDNWIDQTTKK